MIGDAQDAHLRGFVRGHQKLADDGLAVPLRHLQPRPLNLKPVNLREFKLIRSSAFDQKGQRSSGGN